MAEKADDLKTREEKIAQAKELYSRGSRNYLVKLYSEAADDLSQVCALYEEIYGNLADELGMPYLLYAKSLLALEEYKVIDVPDEEEDDDDGDDDDEEEEGSGSDATVAGTTTEENGGSKDNVDSTLPTINEDDEGNEEKIEKKEVSNKDVSNKDATNKEATNNEAVNKEATNNEAVNKEAVNNEAVNKEALNKEAANNEAENKEATNHEAVNKEVTNNEAVNKEAEIKEDKQKNKETIKDKEDIGEKPELPSSTSHIDITDDEKMEIENEKKESVDKIDNAIPSTSNGKVKEDGEETTDDADEAATNLQLAWEILELAAKIFERQGESALPNLAEVKTELGNIQFENNILDAAREDYNNALKIYNQLPSKYRRAMAEIHYKIGLTYLSQEQQSCKESAESLKKACQYLDEEIKEAKDKPDLTEQEKLNIEDMKETRQEIWVKITEIEETRQQCLAEVRAALDNYKSPSKDPEMAGPSSSTSVSSKPATDISHLIKRKKPDSTTSDAGSASADVGASPAKRPAL